MLSQVTLKKALRSIELFTKERGEEGRETELLTDDIVIHIFQLFGEGQRRESLDQPRRRGYLFL